MIVFFYNEKLNNLKVANNNDLCMQKFVGLSTLVLHSFMGSNV